ncbi:MAG: hypothetical protein PHI35_04160 [Victivallaceae bacterium]|nr:hypothetical protein [Victivallaceae bacterium]
MNITFWIRSSLAAVLCAVVGGCGVTAHRIEPGGPDALVTVTGVDAADWNLVANKAIGELLSSGALKRKDGRQAVVMVSRVRNYTLLHLESAILTNKMRSAIGASGQARVTSAVGYGGNIDLAVRRIRAKDIDDIFASGTVPKRGTVTAPNFSLSGMIVQQTTRSGRTEEGYYQFYLALTDLATGVAVWETTVDFAKQATRSVI